MQFPPRRVVTGRDSDGRAVVTQDEVPDNVNQRRPGHRSYVLWATEEVPADCDTVVDTSPQTFTARVKPNGTVFRIAEYGPGVAPARHQTDSIDYAVVLSGQIDLVLDDQTVTLRAGDTLVQRGTSHDWVNHGTEPCVIVFCLIGAKPA